MEVIPLIAIEGVTRLNLGKEPSIYGKESGIETPRSIFSERSTSIYYILKSEYNRKNKATLKNLTKKAKYLTIDLIDPPIMSKSQSIDSHNCT